MRCWLALALVACGSSKEESPSSPSGNPADTDSTPLDTAAPDACANPTPPPATASCESTVDLDEDGDGVVDTRTVQTWNAAGALETEDEDYAPFDGIADAVGTYTYDADGHLTSYELDVGVDGILEEHATYTWTNGLLTATALFAGSAGFGVQTASTFVYDAYGVLIEVHGDSSRDGVDDWVDFYRYDAYGHLAEVDTDADADGAIDGQVLYAYPGPGPDDFVATADDDLDGQTDRQFSESFDACGRMWSFADDQDDDGVVDSDATYTWDAAGHLTREEFHYHGSLIDVDHTYDAFDREISKITTVDGVTTEVATTSWSC